MSLSQSHFLPTMLFNDRNSETNAVHDDDVIETIDLETPHPIEAPQSNETVVQNFPNSVIKEINQSDASEWEVEDFFQPTYSPPERQELELSKPRPLSPFSISDDPPFPLEIQHKDPSIKRDQTVIQYMDAAIYQPADQTIAQNLTMPVDSPTDETVIQRSLSPVPWNTSEDSSTAIVPQAKRPRSINFLALFHWRGRSPMHAISSAARKMFHPLHQARWPKLRHMGSRFPRRIQSKNAIAPLSKPSMMLQASKDSYSDRENQASTYLYQKTLQELDHCRLSFGKELARNGKFREAIAVASQISESSRFFNDAQILVQSWSKL